MKGAKFQRSVEPATQIGYEPGIATHLPIQPRTGRSDAIGAQQAASLSD